MSKKNKVLLWLVFISPFIGLFGSVQLAALGVFGDLPTFDQLENPKNNLATEIISEDGVVLGKYFIENRSRVRYNGYPKLNRFVVGNGRYRFANTQELMLEPCFRLFWFVSGKKGCSGADTITQQLAMLFTERLAQDLGRLFKN